MSAQPDDTTIEIPAQPLGEQPAGSHPATSAGDLGSPSTGNRGSRYALYGGIALLAAGALVLYLGYEGAATTTAVAAQIPYIASGGLAGVGLLTLGGMFVALHAFLASQGRLQAHLQTLTDAVREMTDALGGTSRPSRNGAVVVTLRGGSSYHRGDCALVSRGRGAGHLARDEARRRGFAPCRICRP